MERAVIRAFASPRPFEEAVAQRAHGPHPSPRAQRGSACFLPHTVKRFIGFASQWQSR